MVKWKLCVFLLSFFLILYIPYMVHGADLDTIIDDTARLTAPFGFQADRVARQVLSGEVALTFSNVLSFLGDLFFGKLRENLSLIVKIAAAGLISGIFSGFPDGKQKIGGFVCAFLISLMALESFSYAETVAEETLDGLFLFVQGLLPTVGTAAVASGSALGAKAVSSVFLAMQVFMQILRQFMLPLIAIITVFSVCCGMGEQLLLEGVVSFLKQVFRWCTGLLLLLYGGVIGVTAIAGTVFDQMAGKTVKYAVGNLVPVIGGALADSLETVTNSAKAIRGALGVSGVIGIGTIAVSPVLTLGTLALCYKMAGTVVSLWGDKRTVGLICEIGSSVFRLLAVVVAAAVMFFISVAMLCFMGGGA